MTSYCVTRGKLVAHHDDGRLLTWETHGGALRFAAMNGGTVTPVAELDRAVSTIPTYGPLQHSPDEARPLEG